MQEKQPLGKRIVHALLALVLAVVLLAAFFLAVIMGHPQSAGTEPARVSQPLLPPMSSIVTIRELGSFQKLLDASPAPVLASMSSTAMRFVQGTCTDVPFDGGYARVTTLTYETVDGSTVSVQSIYPARALDVMGKGDYAISGTAGQPLAGLRSIRMEKDGAVRMHAQGEEALYVVTLPDAPSAALRQLTSTLQLYGGSQHD